MSSAPNPRISSTRIKLNCDRSSSSFRLSILRLPERRSAPRRLQSFNASAETSVTSNFTSVVGSSSTPQQLSHWNFTRNHIIALNVIACAAAVSATWLFCSAIPTLLAFKRAAESMEKLLDVTREELPGTMAAVRLSGMEISDLTMELSDLSQQFTQGVRGSTRAVRIAEERLRQLTNTAPTASMQEFTTLETRTRGPIIAKTARSMKEAVVKGRTIWKVFFTLAGFSKMVLDFFGSRV